MNEIEIIIVISVNYDNFIIKPHHFVENATNYLTTQYLKHYLRNRNNQ